MSNIITNKSLYSYFQMFCIKNELDLKETSLHFKDILKISVKLQLLISFYSPFSFICTNQLYNKQLYYSKNITYLLYILSSKKRNFQ